METIKTAFVVVLLLAVLYGVYVVLNKPDLAPPPEAAWESESAAPPKVEIGTPTDLGMPPATSTPSSAAGTLADTGAPSSFAPPSALGASSEPARPPSPWAPLQPSASDQTGTASHAHAPGEATPDNQAGGIDDAQRTVPDDSSAQVAAATLVSDQSADNVAVIGDSGPVAHGGPDPAASVYAKPNEADVSDEGEIRTVRAFDNAWNSAIAQLEKGQWAEALFTLSFFYNDPDLTAEERSRLVDLLDPLAGKVIYSTEHILEPPYEVQPGESLQAIADRYHVPMALLQNINGIQNPEALAPGTQLKVVRGPFRAEIDLKRNELILFLGKYYAGRFPVSVGNDPAPQPAEYEVQAKQPGREYLAPDGTRVAPNAPNNPYGAWWIGLGGDVSIHASPETLPAHGGLGCISLKTADARDVYGILSIGSKVSIR